MTDGVTVRREIEGQRRKPASCADVGDVCRVTFYGLSDRMARIRGHADRPLAARRRTAGRRVPWSLRRLCGLVVTGMSTAVYRSLRRAPGRQSSPMARPAAPFPQPLWRSLGTRAARLSPGILVRFSHRAAGAVLFG